MESGKVVLILGAGVGGIVAANQLRKFLPKSDRIIVIDRAKKFYFAPSFLWLMTGDRKTEDISKPLENLKRKGIEFICDEIESIDPQEKSVRTKNHEFKGDILIIALGAEYTPEIIPGLKETGHTFYTLEGSQTISKQLETFQKGKIAILTAAPQYKCPAAPYEAAMLLESFCKKKGIRENVQIDFFAAEAAPMSTGGPHISAAVCKMLESKNIHYHPNHKVVEVISQTREIRFSNEKSAAFDLLLYVPPHGIPKVLKNTALVSESGWIPVDERSLETHFKDVYAIGDVNFIPLKIGKPLPKAGVFADAEAQVVSYNIKQKLNKKDKFKSYDGEGYCFVETGDLRAGIGKGYFYEDPPRMKLYTPNLLWHFGKVLVEKYWLWKWL